MNREIKFRGLDVSGNTWHYGFLAIPEVGKYAGRSFISNKAGMPLAFEVRPETVGQLTGRKDKKGIEIYEGDALHFLSNDVRRVVVWADEIGGFALQRHGTTWSEFYRSDRMEVIGNIYENPELVEDGQS